MALESLVFNIAETFLEKLASKAYQEISFAWGIEEELQNLTNTLRTIQAVLLDAEEQQTQNVQLRVWLADLRNAL